MQCVFTFYRLLGHIFMISGNSYNQQLVLKWKTLSNIETIGSYTQDFLWDPSHELIFFLILFNSSELLLVTVKNDLQLILATFKNWIIPDNFTFKRNKTRDIAIFSFRDNFCQLGKFCTAHKMNFSIKDFFSKNDQIRWKLRIWSHSLKKSLMEKLVSCVVWNIPLH